MIYHQLISNEYRIITGFNTIITMPTATAQSVPVNLVKYGIQGSVNYTPAVINPFINNVFMQNIDVIGAKDNRSALNAISSE